MSIFVTVGSTSFDDLIQTTCSEEFLNFLVSSGFKEITLQIGKGNFIPEENPLIKISWYRFKDDISDNIKRASLIIGHGGAGTILETLIENKPLIVVLNEKLMDNHQNELAEKLGSENCLKYSSCCQLKETLQAYIAEDFSRTRYELQADKFHSTLHHILGIK